MNQYFSKPIIDVYSNFNRITFGILILFELLVLLLISQEYNKTALLLGLSVFVIFAFIHFFKNPFVLLGVFLFSILAGAIEIFNIGGKSSQLSFVDFLFPILILVYFIKNALNINASGRTGYPILKLFYVLFLAWGLFSVYISVDQMLAIAYWRNYLAGFIILSFSLFVLKDVQDVKKLLNIIILWGVILAIIEFSILISLGGITAGLMKIFFTKNLLATSWGKSNYLATFFVLIIPIAAGYFLATKNTKLKIYLSLSLVLMFSAILLTLSKGGILSLVVAMIIFLSRAIKVKTLVPILIVLVIITIVLLLNPLTYVIFEGLTKLENTFSTMTRINFYKDVWNIILENPLTGIGLGNLGFYAKFQISGSASAHNLFLGLVGETGIVGAILFLSILFLSFKHILKNYLKENNERLKVFKWSLISAFTGVMIHSMIEPNFEGFQFNAIFWLFTALSLRLTEFNEYETNGLFGANS